MNPGTENRGQRMSGIRRPGKAGAAVGAALGVIALFAGAMLLLYSLLGNRLETGAVRLADAEEADTYAYIRVQYMTASFARYEASQNLQFYIGFDEDLNPAILCVKDQELSHYQPYIDWMYSSGYENGPEAVNVAGYAQKIDGELKNMALEAMETVFGERVVDEDSFSQVFGAYYLNVGPKNSAYGYGTAGILLLVAGLLATALCGVRLLKKEKEPSPYPNGAPAASGSLRQQAGYMPPPQSDPYDYTYASRNNMPQGNMSQDNMSQNDMSQSGASQSGAYPNAFGSYADMSQNTGAAGSYTVPYTEPEKGSRALGILGAVAGALLGGLIWAVVGAFGLISGWIGLLIVVMAIKGYQLLSKREDDKFGTVISVILGLLVIAPATYLSGAWSYYRELNKVIPGYISFWEALAKMPEYLSEYNEWGILLQNMAMGYLFAGIASIYFVIGMFAKNKRNK